MTESDYFVFKPNDAEKNLAAELERFSFGAAVSSNAEVYSIDGPDEFVKTIVHLGGIIIKHAQHPETHQQNISLKGENVPEDIAGIDYVFDTTELMLMRGSGPPVSEAEVSEVASTVKNLNDIFDKKS